MNIQVHPTLGAAIASAVNSRCLASEMISNCLHAKPYVHEDFQFWVRKHIEATHQLAAMGIPLPTYEVKP